MIDGPRAGGGFGLILRPHLEDFLFLYFILFFFIYHFLFFDPVSLQNPLTLQRRGAILQRHPSELLNGHPFLF